MTFVCGQHAGADNGIWAGSKAPAPTLSTKRLEEGMRLSNKQRFEQACKLFDSVNDFSLLSYNAEQAVCQSYVSAGDFAKALQVLDALILRERQDNAITVFQKGQTRRIRADALSGVRRYDEAVKEYILTAQLRPDATYSLLYHAGNILSKTNRPKEAIVVLQKAIAAGCTNGLANKCLGDCSLKLGKPKDAFAAYKASIKTIEKLRLSSPDNETTCLVADYKGLIEACRQLKLSDEAKAAQAKLDSLVAGWHEDLFGAPPEIK